MKKIGKILTLPFQLLKKLLGLLLLPFRLLGKILAKPLGFLLKPFRKFFPKKDGEKKKFSLKDLRTMPKKKLILLLLLLILLMAAAAFGVLKAWEIVSQRQQQEPVEPELPPVPVEIPLPVITAPVAYEVVGESVFGIPVGDSVEVREERLDEEEEPTEDEASKKEGEEVEPEPEPEPEPRIGSLPLTEYVIYYYDFPQPNQRLTDYCMLLTAEDMGFKAVDEKVMEREMPDLQALSGQVHLVRPIPVEVDEEGNTIGDGSARLMSLRISWDQEGMAVNVSELKGSIVIPPPPKPMTLAQAIEFMYDSDPAVLGLSGESMAEYDIMPMDGAVLVGTVPCQRMNVYGKNPKTGTNVIAGQFLLSGDGRYLYRIDENGELKAVKR